MRDWQYLAVTGLMPYVTGVVELTRLAAQHNCHLQHFQVHGQQERYLLNGIIQGKWSAIAKMENALQHLQKKEHIALSFQRIHLASPQKPAISYLLYLSTAEDSSALNKVLYFLTSELITVQDITIERYLARHTHTPMTHITLRVHLSTQTALSEWRENFIVFCDELNIDAAMEPEKI